MVKRGKFVVIDGLDGVGKGVFLDVFIEEAKKCGKRVFDVHQYWKEHNWHPDPNEIIGNYKIIITSEPTFVRIGKHIRNEIIAEGRSYSPRHTALLYARDRKILYRDLLMPVLKAGIDVYQSRSFSTSLVYQRQSALDQGVTFLPEEILKIPGNAYCCRREHLMDYLIIPTVSDIDALIKRLNSREKQDNCMFEAVEFQRKIKPHYESNEFQQIFTRRGVNVVYLDAGVSIEHSRQLASEFYGLHLR